MYWIIKDVLRHPQIAIKYLLAGNTGAFLNVLSFYLLTHFLGMWYILAAVYGAVIGYVVAFLLHKYWTFADYNNKKFTRQALAYFVVTVLNLMGGIIILTIFVELIGTGHVVSQIIAVCSMAIVSFSVNRHVTFNHKVI